MVPHIPEKKSIHSQGELVPESGRKNRGSWRKHLNCMQFHQQSRSSFSREMTGRDTVEKEKSQFSLGCLPLVPRRLPLAPTARDVQSIAGTWIEYSNKSTRHILRPFPLPTPSTYQSVPQTHGNPSQSAIDAPSHEVSRFST